MKYRQKESKPGISIQICSPSTDKFLVFNKKTRRFDLSMWQTRPGPWSCNPAQDNWLLIGPNNMTDWRN